MQYFGFQIERTKKGLPAIWEEGGGHTNTGDSRIVCDRDGQPKKAIYIKRKGHLSNSKHALIVVEAGDYIIDCYHHRKDFTIRIYRIVSFSAKERDEDLAIAELLYVFSEGEWNAELPAFLKPAVEAGMQKATCYHCREAHYIQ